MKKVISILLTILICMVATVSYAANISAVTGNSGWISDGGIGTTVDEVRGKVISIIQVIGATIAVVMLIALGVKYMASTPDDRAEIKKHMVPYLVGVVFIFAATGLLGIIRTLIVAKFNK